MESSSLDVGLLCARHLLHWAEEETLFVAFYDCALSLDCFVLAEKKLQCIYVHINSRSSNS